MMPVNYRLLGEHFFLVDQHDEHETLYAEEATSLQQPEAMTTFLAKYAASIKASELDVAAAYLSSFCSGMLVSTLYSLSAWNRSLSLPLEELTIKITQQGEYSQIRTVVQEFGGLEGPNASEDRTQWVRSQLTTLIQETLRPIVESAAQASGLNPGFLWGQMPTRVGFYVERLLGDPAHSSINDRLSKDYAVLLDLGPDVFGRNRNPMVVKPRYIEDYREPGKQLKMKNVCCLYHKTDGGDYCYSCPKLKESERSVKAEKLRELYAAAATQ
ncbi:(2Fe-2S)-binding protein [Paenibacillus daejeonensis]|uniref:(2Fe-2S)-binding protein n=1 Tax=Paenibacillus daejeonensis TaxID=135193 RepID=UPI000363E926|nr:(2Fe-2S)-binding protein [Paenibacillus daejeonensis]